MSVDPEADLRMFVGRIASADRRAVVRALVELARSVAQFVGNGPEGEHRDAAVRTIHAAERWMLYGQEADRGLAGRAGLDAYFYGRDSVTVYSAAWYATNVAANLGMYLSLLDTESEEGRRRDILHEACMDAVSAHSFALFESGAQSTPPKERARGFALGFRKMLAEVPWSLTVPTAAQMETVPERIAVAWDVVSAEQVEFTLADLDEAWERALRLGLTWEVPVQRAIAERMTCRNWQSATCSRCGECSCDDGTVGPIPWGRAACPLHGLRGKCLEWRVHLALSQRHGGAL